MYVRNINKLAGILLLFMLSMPLMAGQLVVLVHGYASNAGTWDHSGITGVLTAHGWHHVAIPGNHEKRYYAAHLPAQAPLLLQSRLLQQQLAMLRQHYPEDRLTLVGHSAGGVVARLSVLSGNPMGVSQLVTIASPNMGTPRAIQGIDVVEDKPFFCPGPGWHALKSYFGGRTYRYLEDSRHALRDMLPTDFRNLTSWANLQPHPAIEYHAVVRQYGDVMVPAYSQDLNNVPMLRGKARVWLTHWGHFLDVRDAGIIQQILGDT